MVCLCESNNGMHEAKIKYDMIQQGRYKTMLPTATLHAECIPYDPIHPTLYRISFFNHQVLERALSIIEFPLVKPPSLIFTRDSPWQPLTVMPPTTRS